MNFVKLGSKFAILALAASTLVATAQVLVEDGTGGTGGTGGGGTTVKKLSEIAVGTKFTATVDHATRTFGSHLAPSQRSIEVEKLADGKFKVTADGQTFESSTIRILSAADYETFKAEEGKQDLLYLSTMLNKDSKKVDNKYADVVFFAHHKDFKVENNDLPDSTEIYFTSIGSVTPAVPTSNTVTYNGHSWGAHTSDIELVADFSTQHISGTMSNFAEALDATKTHEGTVAIASTQITTDGFTAKVSGHVGTYENLEGSMTGQFYGGAAEEIAGTFNLKYDKDSENAFDIGGFIAIKE